MEVLRQRQRFMEVDWSSLDKIDEAECECKLAP